MPRKKKQDHSAHVSRALVAVLIGVIAVPTAMTGLFQSIDDDGVNAVPLIDLRTKARHDASRVRQLRRDYWQAVDIYNETERLDIDNIGPPDINNHKSIQYYLNPENFAVYEAMSGVHAAASEPSIISDAERAYRALPETYRDLMDGYITAGYCPNPAGLINRYPVQFIEICQSLLEERKEATMPRLNFSSKSLDGFQPVGYAPLRNLRNRLENLEESLLYEGGTSVRPRTHNRVTRPRLDYRHLRTGR